MNLKQLFLLFVLPFLLSAISVNAQNVSVRLGSGEIALNQAFTITVSVKNERIKDYGQFPNINGFKKRGISSSSNTVINNGRASSTSSITQNYLPIREGVFKLNPFSIKVNGTVIKSNGKRIKVGPAKQRASTNDPFNNSFFDEFFGRNSVPPGEEEFINVKADAFLALSTNKDEIYVGEGVTASLALYVSETNRAFLDFYELSQQLAEASKKITPANSWEESFNIESINREVVNIGGKRYTKYKLFQSTYYPLNAEDLKFPSIPLKMVKYKVSNRRTIFGQNRKQDFKTFYTKAKTIKVKELPPHPLKDQVAVGDYYLKEKITTEDTETGKSFKYRFNIYGEGNISAIDAPIIPENEHFDFYPPTIQQRIKRSGNIVTGTKKFEYYGIPNEPGEYPLKDYFSWVFFNPKTAKYDTLASEITLNVTGESKKNQSISANDLGSFYDIIDGQDNQLTALNGDVYFKTFANVLILVMLVLSLVFIFKK